MSKLRIAVCDDDETALIAIKGSLIGIFDKMNTEVEIDAFSQPKEFVKGLEANYYNLVFLDIEMPQIDGLKLGKMLKEKYSATEIIYISNRDDLVFNTFRVHPFGFVRKRRFIKDLADVVTLYMSAYNATTAPQTVVFRFNGKDITLEIKEIKYIESERSYQCIYRENGKEPIRLRESMDSLTKELEPLGFIRIHKGFIVNFMYIRRIDSKTVTMTEGIELPVSRRLVADVRARYMQLCRSSGFVRINKNDSE